MNEIKQEILEMKKDQSNMGRQVKFLLNTLIIWHSIEKANEDTSKFESILGVTTAVLALISQISLLFEDLQEVFAEND